MCGTSSDVFRVHMSLHHLAVMTQLSGIHILSLMHVGDPYIPLFKFEEFVIYLYTCII